MTEVIMFSFGVLGGFLLGVAVTIGKYAQKVNAFKLELESINSILKGNK